MELLEVRTGHVVLDPSGMHTHCKIFIRSQKTSRKFDKCNLRVHLQNKTRLAKKATRDNTLICLRNGIEK